MSLSNYLAKNYLTADPSPSQPSKKRKRKDKSASNSTGLVIAEDDDGGWGSSNRNQANGEDDENYAPTTVDTSAGFRKTKKNNWTVVGGPAPGNADQAAADKILEDAAREERERVAEENREDAPMVVDNSEHDAPPRMESGAVAGLQTAAQVAAQVERKKKEDRRRFEEAEGEGSGKGQETIYRDASGRIINVAMKRAEARKKQAEEEKKKQDELEGLKGDVQRREKEDRAAALQDAKYMNVARYADDTEMNEELKEKERWNDPAARFLTKKKEGKSASGKPLYKGGAPPNRYGIRPGYRWDGVDRSNGFEKEYFAAKNRRQNVASLEYQWQMDE